MEASIGIRREDKSRWERRAPLAPEHVAALVTKHGVRVVVQPSEIRVFGDDEYRAAGAVVDEDLSGCNLVVAVKEIPTKLLEQGKVYMYFSHTIKAQPYNMAMLGQILDLGCTLMDHEKVVDDSGRRLVLFSYHAGLAGMIDTLWALGQRLGVEGVPSPLQDVRQAYEYDGLADAEDRLKRIGAAMGEAGGLPGKLGPVVVGFAGYGNVSQGAQHIFDLLGPKTVEPEDLGDLEDGQLYKVVFHERHMAEPKAGEFDLQTYYREPDRYRGVFGRYLDQLTVLVNCIYWEERYPRLVTIDRLEELFGQGKKPTLRVIGDISCDIGGAVEATAKPTQPDDPVYVYDLDERKPVSGVEGRGPVIMAVDNLPCELPREATESFGSALAGLLPEAARADYTVPFAELDLPPPMKGAVIVHRGELTGEYQYLEEHAVRGDNRRDQ